MLIDLQFFFFFLILIPYCSPFRIHINDQKYKVVPPERERMQAQDLKKLDDIKALVSQVS